MKEKFRVFCTKAMLVVAVFVLLFELTAPSIVFALPTTNPDKVAQDTTFFVKDETWKKIWNTMKTAGRVAFKNAMKTFLGKVAYESATWLASGFQGQKPFYFYKPWDKERRDAWLSAGVDFVQTFASELGPLSFDICAFDPNLKLGITLGLGREIKPRQPACEWSQLASHWKNIGNSMKDKGYLKRLGLGFSPSESDLGVALTAHQTMFNSAESRKLEKTIERWAQKGTKALSDPVSDFVKTPATVILGEEERKRRAEEQAEAWFTDDIWADAISVFSSTLISKGMKNLVNFIGKQFADDEELVLETWEADVGSLGGTKAAQARFASLNTVSFTTTTNIDLLNDFESCPVETLSLNNCTVDNKFAQAIRERKTVAEALKDGLLSGSWPFGFKKIVPGMQAGKEYEPDVNEGYSYSNMRKLRLYRVLPLGWEIAAEKIARGLDDGKSYGKIWTLKEVMDQFNSKSSPFYHLVDPNWVLKIPPQECSVNAPSAVLADESVRVDTCADVKTCLAENEGDNSCATKFGYCTREENVWRLNGNVCPSYYDSCKRFARTADRQEFPLLQNTVDFDSCNANNAGCEWYSTNQKQNGEWFTSELPQNRIYFNKNLAECKDTEAGCSEFIRSQRGTGTNLVRNGSFEEAFDLEPEEIDDTNLDDFIGWKDGATLGYASSDAVYKNISLRVADGVADGNAEKHRIEPSEAIDTGYPLADRTFTLSFFSKNCVAQSKFLLNGGTEKPFDDDTSDWKRYSSTVYFPQGTGQREILFYIDAYSFDDDPNVSAPADRICRIDGIQIEEGVNAGVYVEYGENNLVYLPKAPSYLNCQGTNADSAECNKYAKVCSEAEVGCNRYKPVSYNGPQISGVIQGSDLCPVSCIGYRTYKQSGNYFESDKFPSYFIAPTAQSCTAEAEGCSEFTNLDELDRTGAERKEYYTYLRQCIKPNDMSRSGATYYTWQGSDKSGYYLKAYNLVKLKANPVDPNDIALRNAYVAAQLAYDPLNPLDPNEEPPAYYVYFGASEMQDPDFMTALSAQLGKLFAQCNSVSFDDGTAPGDCLQFYDAFGNVSFRLLSSTVSVSDDCHPFRKTRDILTEAECVSYLDPAGNPFQWKRDNPAQPYYCSVEKNDCILSGGTFDLDLAACIYEAIPEEGTKCSEEANMCREYKGNFSYDLREALRETFEGSPDLTSWYGGFNISTEALEAGGHSLKVSDNILFVKNESFFKKAWDKVIRPVYAIVRMPSLNGGYVAIPVTDRLKKEEGEINDVYLFSFMAKGRGNLNIGFKVDTDGDGDWATGVVDLPANGEKFSNGGVALTEDWKSYHLGPIVLDRDLDDNDQVALYIEMDPISEPYFIDDIVLSETTDIFFLKKNSWKTPLSCDLNPFGVSAPQYNLGCEAYQDMNTQVVNAKSFSNLCEADKAGCEAILNTQNSASPWQETWNALCLLPDADGNGFPDVCSDPAGCDCNADFALGTECRVGAGLTSCRYYRLYNDVPNASLDLSTEVISKDAIQYLVNDPKKQCRSQAKGCTELGKPMISKAGADDNVTVSEVQSVYKRNDPDQYGQTLCSAEFAMCQEYTNKTSKYYFKDPVDRVCVLKQLPEQESARWYKKYKTCRGGSGEKDGIICYGSKEESECSETGGLCKDEICPIPDDLQLLVQNPKLRMLNPQAHERYQLFTQSSGICVEKATGDTINQACSSNNDCPVDHYCYLKWAYECEAEYDQCSVFQDNFGRQPYFYLDDDKVDKKSCNSLVSQKSGCALFENDNILETAKGPVQKLWSSHATYQNSMKNENKDVVPIDCANRENVLKCQPIEPYQTGFEPSGSCDGGPRPGTKCASNADCGGGGTCDFENWGECAFSSIPEDNGKPCPYENQCGDGKCVFPNDSNDIVKVRRDRVCGEWLDCVSEFKAEDASGNPIEVCSQIQRCRTLQEGSTECAKFVSDYCTTNSDCYDLYGTESTCENNFCVKTRLTASAYQKRDVSWAGKEYAGYSLFEKYPIEEYRQGTAGQCADGKVCFSQYDCAGNGACTKPNIEDWRLSYFDTSTNHPVSQGIDGSKNAPLDSHDERYPSVVPKSCRAYPESDSPFSRGIDPSGEFSNVNRCGEDPDENPWGCECTYKKKIAGGRPIYLDTKGSMVDPKTGLCAVADVESDVGKPCTKNSDCGTEEKGATCGSYDKSSTEYGWAGYCLEKDFKHNINGIGQQNDFACLTWFPAGIVRGEVDTFNYSVNAGYTLAENRNAYCALALADTNPQESDWILNSNTNTDASFGRRDREQSFGGVNSDIAPWTNVTGCSNEGDGQIDGCFSWCYAPRRSMIGCYVVSDNDGTTCPNSDVQYNDSVKAHAGRLVYPWIGPKIYRHAIKAIRFVVRVQVEDIRSSQGTEGCFVSDDPDFADNDDFPHAPWDEYADFSKQINILPTACYGSDACIDLWEENGWDSDPGKKVGDQSNNCDGDNEGCLRFKANWKKEGETSFDVLESMEVWGMHWNGYGIFAVRFIEFYDADHCKLIVSAIDDNLNGPNVIARTDRLWDQNNGTVNGYRYTTTCEPFGTMALGSEYNDGTHRIITRKASDDGQCKQDLYWANWGDTNANLDQNDPIFELFGKVLNTRSRSSANTTDVGKDRFYYSRNNDTKDFTYSIGRGDATAGPWVFGVRLVTTTVPPSLGQGYSRSVSGFGGQLTGNGNISVVGDGKVDLSFYAYDQLGKYMPLRKIMIDWNVPDNSSPTGRTIQTFEGSYKNHKETCSGAGFGDSSDACVESPFSYSFVYTCDGPGAPGWQAYDNVADDDDGDGIVDDTREDTTGKCVFRPRVQVKNNWGWCNIGGPDGRALADYPCVAGVDGCYGGSEPGAPNDCDLLGNKRPWAFLWGDSDGDGIADMPQYIIVSPKE
jgi:hypothetical protein